MNLEYTFWLLPAEPHKTHLRKVIDDLAQEFRAPPFDAHMTVYHGPSNAKEAEWIVKKIAADHGVMSVPSDRLEQSSRYSKTLFVQYSTSEKVQHIFEDIQGNIAIPHPYVLDPHVSLLYQHLSQAQRKQLCRRALVPMDKYVFDTICAVEFETPWSEKSVREYRIVAQEKLKAA